MCGIAGILNLDGAPVERAVLADMGTSLAHRGPDGEGLHVEQALGFAHRRLAVIDLTDGGAQPMTDANGRFVLNYNGEVYNFRELRAELGRLGHHFRSSSDSEVVLHSYLEWGADCVQRFNGMFAFAVWDSRKRSLFLARDRYGIKPLYLARCGDAVLFASEAKAFLCHPRFSPQLDREALVEYLTFQNLFTDRTLLEGVRLLPPGHHLTIDAGTGAHLQQQYWDFDFAEPDQPATDDEYLEELDRLFEQAVHRQLVSDVPVSSYLSGGMDSGSITAVAAQAVPNLRTFTVGFDLHSASGMELAFDERERSEHMSYLFGTEHYEMVLKAGDMERCMPSLTWHLEEPRVGQSYPNYYAAHLAGKFGKVVLSGGGGDELFGGYPWRYYRAVVNDDFEHYASKYFDFWQRMLPAEALPGIFAPIADAADAVDPRSIFRDVFARHASELTRPADYVNHSLYLESKTFLHGLLVMEDKLSMAHGLETRLPFLDNDLVDFAMRVPVRLKLGNLGHVVGLNENEPGPKTAKYFDRTKDGKLLLRAAMGRHIPAVVTEREKQGFSAPDASWFRGESIDYVRRRLMGPAARIYDVLDREATQCLIADHLEGRENRRLLIWSLLSLEEWFDAFITAGRQ